MMPYMCEAKGLTVVNPTIRIQSQIWVLQTGPHPSSFPSCGQTCSVLTSLKICAMKRAFLAQTHQSPRQQCVWSQARKDRLCHVIQTVPRLASTQRGAQVRGSLE